MSVKLPLYKKLFFDLKKSIDEGKYPVGSLLPSENDLCEKYGTTRATVRHSLKELQIIGYIMRQHGKGSIVAEPKKGLGILSIRGVTAAMGDANLKTKILQQAKNIPGPKDFFYEITDDEIQKGCIFLTRIRLVNDLPVLYEETFLTNTGLTGFTSLKLENKSLFSVLNEKYRIEVKEGEQKIWAIGANKYISAFLKVKPGAPIVYMNRKLKTNNKGVNIYSFIYCNTREYYLQDYF
jgi:DNA-binding GntR family transcriptional regulator